MKLNPTYLGLAVVAFLLPLGSQATPEWIAVGMEPATQNLRLEPQPFLYRRMEPRWEQSPGIDLHSGTVYQLEIVARAGDPSETTALRAVVAREQKDGELQTLFSCGPVLGATNETFTAPFSVSKNIPADDLRIALVYGYGTTAIEVERARIVDLGSGKPLTAYVRTGRWYAGQEPDAAWRKQAQSMIASNRMGEFDIQLVDGQGEPVEGGRVIVEQQSHAYRFGTAVNSTLWHWMTADAASNPQLQAEFEYYRRSSGRTELTFVQRQAEIRKYFEVLKSDFNYAVFENALKWQAWAGEWGGFRHEDTLALTDWLIANGLEVKGHTLVWPGWGNAPAFVKSLADRPEALNRLIHAHITDVGSAMNGRVVSFDVLNEAFSNHNFMDVIGNEAMAGWFKQAKAVLPDAQLNVNDFLLMANGAQWTEKLDFYDHLVGNLLEEGAPLSGIGFQSHFRHTYLTSPERIWELCDRFGRYGLPLVCSEFDVNIPDEQLQAAYLRDFLTAWFAHPDTVAFLQWGFWQDSHWLPYAGLYTRDWRMKPNAKVYRELVYDQWWSGWEEAQSAENGKVALRGFLGTYRVTAYANGHEVVLENIELKKDGTSLSIQL